MRTRPHGCRRIPRLALVLLSALGLTLGSGALAGRKEPPPVPTEQAPEAYTARIETTKGDIVVEVQRALAPYSADRFYNMIRSGYLEKAVFITHPWLEIKNVSEQYEYPGNGGFENPDLGQWRIHPVDGWEWNGYWARILLPFDVPVREAQVGDVVFLPTEIHGKKSLWTGRYDVSRGIAGRIAIVTGDSLQWLNRLGAAPFGRVVQGLDVPGKLSLIVGRKVPNNVYLYALRHRDLDVVSRATVMAEGGVESTRSASAAASAPSDTVGQAQLTVYRPDPFGSTTVVAVDGVVRAAVRKQTAFTVALPAGRHHIMAKSRNSVVGVMASASMTGSSLWTNERSSPLDLRPGQHVFFVALPLGSDNLDVNLARVAPEFGAVDAAKFPQADPVPPDSIGPPR
jgi:hypothetical protein